MENIKILLAMETARMLIDIFSFLSILFLLYNTLRSRCFRCEFDNKTIKVETDAVKEEFRRAALAEISKVSGGRRVEFKEIKWDGKTLKVYSKDQTI